MFKNYLTIALRNLSRNKVYAFINIAGLSIGLACAMLILLYVKDEVSFDKFHPAFFTNDSFTITDLAESAGKSLEKFLPAINGIFKSGR